MAAGEALLRTDPGTFPILFDGLDVVYGGALPDDKGLGFSPEHPIIEILTDIGILIEPEGWWTRLSKDVASDFYVVVIHPRD